MVGPDTWGELVEAGYRLGDRVLYLRSLSFQGDDVRELQKRLNALGFDAGREDGIFGSRTAAAVAEFQHNVGSASDGIVGPEGAGCSPGDLEASGDRVVRAHTGIIA